MIPIADIRSAARRIAGKVHRTPLFSASQLGERAGVRLYLKCENFQKTGSFKPRGALNKVLSLSEAEKARGLVTVSAGNHAQAVAWAARMAGAACAVVMPSSAPRSKMDAVRGYGAEVIEHGDRATLFDKLNEVREARGLTQSHLAAELGTSQSRIVVIGRANGQAHAGLTGWTKLLVCNGEVQIDVLELRRTIIARRTDRRATVFGRTGIGLDHFLVASAASGRQTIHHALG